MERASGFEPPTTSLATKSSTTELHPQKLEEAVGFEPTVPAKVR